MWAGLKREKIYFISIFSVMGTLLSLLAYLLFIVQFTQAYNQYTYLRSSNFEYVYITDEKLPMNSYLNFKNTKSFYIDEGLSTRLQVNSLMQLDVQYDESAFINTQSLLTDTDLILNKLEIFITLETANTYHLKINQFVYSKSKTDQKVYAFRIMGIISDVYSSSYYGFSQLKGLLIFGYDTDEELNSDSDFINYSLFEPSQTIVDNQVNLLNLYNRVELINDPFHQVISFILLQILITIMFSFSSFIILIKDLYNHNLRLKRIGAGTILTKMILTRAATYLLISLITLIIFNMIMTFLFRHLIEFIILSIIFLITTIVVFNISLVVRYRNRGENI